MIPTGFGADKTALDNIDWCGFGIGANLATVDVKDNRILRVRPFKYDAAYSVDHLKPFRLEHEGKVFEEPLHSLIPPTSVAYKKHAFSRNRIPYPLIREDWDPEGTATRKRAASRSTGASAGTRPPTSSPRKSSASTTCTAPAPSWCSRTATARRRSCTRATAPW